MAYVQPLKNKAQEVTSYRVKWRLGGARDGEWQGENFPDKESATLFKDAVNEHAQQWPPGWVKGVGYIDPAAGDEDEIRFRFKAYALAHVENLTGIGEQYRTDCRRDLERWLFPTFGECDVRSAEHFSGDTVQAWVRVLEKTLVHKGQKPKTGEPKWRPMSPKSIRNLHGLLSTILDRAVKSEPPLRTRNPCELTRLPRADDDGAEGGEDIEFLTPSEVAGVTACMERRTDQLLATIKYGTGMRWSEVSALAPECLVDWDTQAPKIRVKRAWKRDGQGGYKMGAPKSKRGRRTVRVSSAVVEAVEELGGEDETNPGRLFFTGDHGRRLPYSTFHDRWCRAVKRAKASGVLPVQKDPTPHDLRHSHAAVLLSAGRGLEYVKVRLGHESIVTTSDTYGHLLPQADDDAMDTIDQSLGQGRQTGRVTAGVALRDASTVHVVTLPDGRCEAFWGPEVARLMAEVWKLEGGRAPVVQPWPLLQWQRGGGEASAVRSELPGRVRLWELGPVVYGPGGEEQAGPAEAYGLRERWVWEWDPEYATADRPAYRHAAYQEGSVFTEAAAWGTDPAEVRREFVKARAQALRMCSEHPALAGVRGERGARK